MYGTMYGAGPYGGVSLFLYPGVGSIKHVCERYCDPTSERIILYNDNSEVVAGQNTGRGFMFAKVYNNMEVEVVGSPFQVSTTVKSDDCSFGFDYLPDSPQCIQLVIAVAGIPTRFQSSDYGRTWLEL